MKDIENKVLDFIHKNNLLEKTSKVYVATSGGADSMALLAFMNKFKLQLGIDIGAIHVNHGIRGETAKRDAEFVKEYCKFHNIEFILFDATNDNIKVPENASEDWARQLRYNYFGSIIKKGIKVATAHTLSDQTETVLFRLARGGSGLNGLSGIPVKRDGYIRPFLCLNRSEIEAFVEYYGTSNITDETNLGDDYARNKIRHYVVPVLKEINSSAEASFGKFCERMNKAQQYIEKQAKMLLAVGEEITGLKYNIESFINVDDIILEEELLQLLGGISAQSERNVEVLKGFINHYNNENTSEVLLGELPISDTCSIVVTNRYITVTESKENQAKDCCVGNNTFGLYSYSVDIGELDQIGFKYNCRDKFDLCNYADVTKLDIKKCKFRHRVDGDTFKPACKTGGKLVKFMRNIPLAEREAVPVLEYNGEIVWVWGLGFTDGFTPTEDSTDILKFTWF